ncbi:MAG: hypothetical protein AB7J32_13340 [Pseudonocardia sp.]
MIVSTTILRHRDPAPSPGTTPAQPTALAPTTAGSGQVFVDDTGRRRRIVRRWAAALGVGAVLYVAAVVGALGDTGVRPGVDVPGDAGNGQVAGFPQDPGTPGLLTARPAAPAATKARPATTTRRPAAPSVTPTAAPTAVPSTAPTAAPTTAPTAAPTGSSAPTATVSPGSTAPKPTSTRRSSPRRTSGSDGGTP